MRSLIITAALLSPIVFLALWQTRPLLGFAIMAASHAALLYATLRPNVQWLGPVITRFRTNEKHVWLTIDDGPEADSTTLVDLLRRYDAKATFFVKGKLAAAHPELIRTIVDAGHSVANHSDTHPSATFWCLPPARIAREVDGCNEALRAITGVAPRWFRAPVGMKNAGVHPQLARRGMRLIGWSARGFDAVSKDVDRVVERIVRRVEPGAIIVLHQGLAHSAAVIERVLQTMQSRGFAFVIPEDDQLMATDAR